MIRRILTTARSDPWWLFTTISLFYEIKSRYDFSYTELIILSPRFGILLAAMLLSLAFTVLDILAVTDALKGRLPSGIDPFWELAFVFKLLTDTVVLDDFKTALDRLHAVKMRQLSRPTIDDDPVDDHGLSSTEIERNRGHSFASVRSWKAKLGSRKSKDKPDAVGVDQGHSVHLESIESKI